MKAVIMAGGFGTRLRPLSTNIPKPMVPMANIPMLEHIVELLKSHGFNEMIMMLYYQPESITSHFGDGSKFGVKIEYLKPDSDLGTAGCVKFTEDKLRERFLVISGDVLTDFDITAALEYHRQKNAVATLVLTRVENPLAYGVVITSPDGKIERFLEKPSWGEVFSDTINTGIYVLEPSVFDYIPAGKNFDFSKDLYPAILADDKGLYGYIATGYWKDIGNLDEYRLGHYDILEGKVKVKLRGSAVRRKDAEIFTGENVKIVSDAEIESGVVIGSGVVIESGAKISRSVIGDNVTIKSGASVSGSIIWSGSTVGEGARLKESVVGYNVLIGNKAVIQVGTVISDETNIGDGATIRAGVKIWPHKTVESGSTLSTSLIWSDKWNKALFGTWGIAGLANIEITPEFATKVGAAYGAYLGKGAYVITSRDAHPACRMIKRTMISGLLSAGVRVGDLQTAPMPVFRYEIGKEGEAGGIHVKMSPKDPRIMDIKFFDANGDDISIQQEKAIEQMFLREDFKRAHPDEIDEVVVPPRAAEYYRTGYLKTINKDVIRAGKMKVVIDYAYSTAALIFPGIFGKLGVEVIALNSYIDPQKVTISFAERRKYLEQLSDIVTTLDADVGFMIDNGAERVYIVDEKGKIIPNETAQILTALLAMKTYKKGAIAVPVNSSCVIDELAASHGFEVLRTPTLPKNMMRYAHRPDVVFVGNTIGGYIFPEFQCAFDALYSIGKILEMMSALGVRLNRLAREIPTFEILHERVPCPWDKKGAVMRKAIEHAKDKRHELIDGVKIYLSKTDWILMLPDAEESYFHLWAETRGVKSSGKLIEEYSNKIKEWRQDYKVGRG
ncbi:MAG: mannose-1-phosphate guanyltransferase [Endomicrobiia bacterium]|nr:mannose-1-phosphate guanyltransferase [Endomicrobiia bacterium]